MDLLAAERIKLLTTRSPWWCSSLTVVLVVLIGLLVVVAQVDPEAIRFELVAQIMQNAAATIGLAIVMVMAAVAVTAEHRYATIRVLFMVEPRRPIALLAKAAVVAIAAGLIGLVTAFATWGLVVALAPGADLGLVTLDRWRAVAGVGVVFAIGAVFAVAVAVVIRHTAGVIALVLVWVLVGESLTRVIPVAGERIWVWLPFVNLDRFLTAELTSGAGGLWTSDLKPFGAWGALAYAAAVVAALLAGALFVAHRRDA